MSPLTTIYQEDALREAAKKARLRYVRDDTPGITRKKVGKNFHYIAPNNERVTAEEIIARINQLAIPPAYHDVWICPLENGHLQATGRDDRKRKQYRYHPKWAMVRSETKFVQMGDFAKALPQIRETVAKHLKQKGLSREKVLATVVTLMDQCNMRVGNEQYAKENSSFGLTTIRKKHVNVVGDNIHFEFIGKSGKLWQRDVNSRQIANIIRHCEEIPGQDLFKWIDENNMRHDVTSDDVNSYLQEISGQPFTAKDFRTWSATAQAIALLAQLPSQESARQYTLQLNAAIKEIAEYMGHTPAICRKCYIYPAVLDAYTEDTLSNWFKKHKHRDDHELVTQFLASH